MTSDGTWSGLHNNIFSIFIMSACHRDNQEGQTNRLHDWSSWNIKVILFLVGIPISFISEIKGSSDTQLWWLTIVWLICSSAYLCVTCSITSVSANTAEGRRLSTRIFGSARSQNVFQSVCHTLLQHYMDYMDGLHGQLDLLKLQPLWDLLEFKMRVYIISVAVVVSYLFCTICESVNDSIQQQ